MPGRFHFTCVGRPTVQWVPAFTNTVAAPATTANAILLGTCRILASTPLIKIHLWETDPRGNNPWYRPHDYETSCLVKSLSPSWPHLLRRSRRRQFDWPCPCVSVDPSAAIPRHRRQRRRNSAASMHRRLTPASSIVARSSINLCPLSSRVDRYTSWYKIRRRLPGSHQLDSAGWGEGDKTRSRCWPWVQWITDVIRFSVWSTSN